MVLWHREGIVGDWRSVSEANWEISVLGSNRFLKVNGGSQAINDCTSPLVISPLGNEVRLLPVESCFSFICERHALSPSFPFI